LHPLNTVVAKHPHIERANDSADLVDIVPTAHVTESGEPTLDLSQYAGKVRHARHMAGIWAMPQSAASEGAMRWSVEAISTWRWLGAQAWHASTIIDACRLSTFG
jgi:hypothetical protein